MVDINIQYSHFFALNKPQQLYHRSAFHQGNIYRVTYRGCGQIFWQAILAFDQSGNSLANNAGLTDWV